MYFFNSVIVIISKNLRLFKISRVNRTKILNGLYGIMSFNVRNVIFV